MKVNSVTKEQMKNDIKVVLFHLCNKQGLNVKDIEFTIPLVHGLWFRVYACRSYEATNPNVFKNEDGSRLLDMVEDYELYPCNTNDKTIETALVTILKEIQKES